jgi:hypothetical protein
MSAVLVARHDDAGDAVVGDRTPLVVGLGEHRVHPLEGALADAGVLAEPGSAVTARERRAAATSPATASVFDASGDGFSVQLRIVACIRSFRRVGQLPTRVRRLTRARLA